MIKIYEKGEDFLKENDSFLQSAPFETRFFYEDALKISAFSDRSYAIQIQQDAEKLLLLKSENFPLLLFGSVKLTALAAEVFLKYHLFLDTVMGNRQTVESFSNEMIRLFGGSFQEIKKMNLLTCLSACPFSSEVRMAQKEDLIPLSEAIGCLYKENGIFNEEQPAKILKDLQDHFEEYAVYAVSGKICSFARSIDNRISSVYTLPSFRRCGYAQKVVSFLTNRLIRERKKPYLYVEQSNLATNQLYQNIGYTLIGKQVQYQYKDPVLRTALFAGGCFWCIAMPFYSVKGVRKVYSGYAGGMTFQPTYQQVKQQATGHRETIMIVYDCRQLSYQKLLDLYFESIDPFDDSGQFIDRGNNYTCAVFTSDPDERRMVIEKIKQTEEKYRRKVAVSLLENSVFYMAEEEHQDYGLKNPEAIEREFELSGRKHS